MLDREGDPDQQDPAGDQRDDDRAHDAARAAASGIVRFLGHVRGGVVAGEGVLRQQQPDQHDVQRAGAEPGVVDKMPEDEARRLVMGRLDGQYPDNDQHAEDVPPHADVVQQRDQPDAELVQQAVHQQDDGVDQDRHPVRGAPAPLQGSERVDEERRAEVDARRHCHLAEEVEPAGEPGPGRSVPRRQLGRPVVQAAGGREAGAHLRHSQADEQGHDADEGPAPDDDGGAAGRHAEAVQGQAAGQDRDDRE